MYNLFGPRVWRISLASEASVFSACHPTTAHARSPFRRAWPRRGTTSRRTVCTCARSLRFRALSTDSAPGSITTGIFRIPGSHTTVHALLKHYLRQIDHADRGSDRVQETVSSATLPAHISYDVDDVASAFKKFLSCFPGGILGSWWLFSILRDISAHDFDAESSHDPRAGSDARAKLIALGIAGLNTSLRIAIVCAVFGLLNMIGAETESKIRWNGGRRESQPTEKMGYQALGVVFGPLLVGEMIDQIQLDGHSRSGSSSGGVTRSPRRPSRMKVAASQQQHDDLTTQLARTNITVQITEMLITEWVGVVRELRRIGLPGPEPHASRSESLGVALEYSNKASGADDRLARARSYDLMPGSVRSSRWRTSPTGMRHPHQAYSTSRGTYDRPRSRMDSKRIKIRSKGSRQRLNGYASDSVLRDGKTPEPRNESLQSSRYHHTSMPVPLPPPAPHSTARSSAYVDTPVSPSVGSTPRQSFELGPSSRLSGVVVGVFDAPRPRFMPYRPNTASSAMGPTEEQELQVNSLTPQSVNSQKEDGTINAVAEARARADGVAQSDLVPYHGAGLLDATMRTTPTALESQESTPRPPTGSTRLSSVKGSPASLHPVVREQLPIPSTAAHGQTIPARCSFEVLPGAMDQDRLFKPDRIASPRTSTDQVPDTARTSRLPSYRIPHRLSSCLRDQGGLYRSPAGSRRSGRRSRLTTDSDMSARKPDEPTLPHQARYMTSTRPDSVAGAMDERGSSSEAQTRTGSSVNNGSVRLHSPTDGPSKGNATLYAEIQRLQRLLDARTEEVTQARRELQAMKDFRDSRAPSEQLHETQKELKAWKARAEWAERRAFTLDWEWKKAYANMNATPTGPGNGNLTSS